MNGRRIRQVAVALAALTLMSSPTACGGPEPAATAGSGDGPAEIRLGYFPNITHATALVGVEKGLFAKHLGNTRLTVSVFNAGPAAVEAIFSGAVDAAYIGPNPAVNAWAKSRGRAIKIIAGAASGGVRLVVRPGMDSADDLRGKRIATPQLGNTQDVALRYWLREKGLSTDTKGGGDVHVVPQDNSQTLQTFATGDIDGAWVPEPFASRLVLESGGKALVDERDLWPGGQFVITHLIVRRRFADEHPDTVRRLLEGHVEANAAINADRAGAAGTVNAALKRLSGRRLAREVLDSAFGNITFTNDPIAPSLIGSADHAVRIGLLEPVDLSGIYHLEPLNEVLRGRGEAEVSGG